MLLGLDLNAGRVMFLHLNFPVMSSLSFQLFIKVENLPLSDLNIVDRHHVCLTTFSRHLHDDLHDVVLLHRHPSRTVHLGHGCSLRRSFRGGHLT